MNFSTGWIHYTWWSLDTLLNILYPIIHGWLITSKRRNVNHNSNLIKVVSNASVYWETCSVNLPLNTAQGNNINEVWISVHCSNYLNLVIFEVCSFNLSLMCAHSTMTWRIPLIFTKMYLNVHAQSYLDEFVPTFAVKKIMIKELSRGNLVGGIKKKKKKKKKHFSGATFHIPLTKSATLNRLLHCSLWQFSGAFFFFFFESSFLHFFFLGGRGNRREPPCIFSPGTYLFLCVFHYFVTSSTLFVCQVLHNLITLKEKIAKINKANAKRGLACCPRDSYKQLAGNGFKFTDPCSLTMGSS